MAKCGDCLYFGFCKKYIDPEETFPEIGGCHTFTDKADLVEVVRCKDCTCIETEGESADVFRQERHCYCTEMNTYMPENGFGIAVGLDTLSFYLRQIAERAIELNDDVLIDLLLDLHVLKEEKEDG